MPLRPNMEPLEYMELFFRRKWLVLFSFVLVMLGAAVYCVAIPDEYRSTTTIMVIPPSVSETYVSPMTRYKIQEHIPAIEQRVISRARLLEVMDELGLYAGERKNSSAEALVEKMRKRIDLRVVKDKDAFTLSFDHEDPKVAMLTTSRLASLFIDENIRNREQQAVVTSEFLDAQLKETKSKLEAQEERVKRYKLQYMGELPQEMQANLNAMARMQDQLRNNADAISRAEDRKLFMESKISDLKKEIETVETQGVDPEDPAQNLLGEIAVRQRKIRELTLKYTSKYPTVMQLEREVKDLKSKVETIRKSGPLPATDPDEVAALKDSAPLMARSQREELRRLQVQVANMNLEISSLKKESAQVRKSIDMIQAKVGRLPQREQEMVSLTRDYDNLKKAYDDLLAKKLGAKVSQNLEVGQKGETFQMIDPPNLPTTPFKPDRLKILGISLLAAIAIGLGGAAGREMLDPALQGPKDFKYFFEYPILASLPVIQAEGPNRARRNLRTALLIGLCSLLSVVAAVLLIYRDAIRNVLQITGGIG